MAIPSTIEELSTTPASNGPSGSDQRTLADDGLRTAYAFIKMLVSEGSDIASATTITPPSTASVFNITGTTAITTVASTNSWDGRIIYLIFAGALTLTNGSNLALPGSANITTAANDVAVLLQTASGAWRCIDYQRAGTFPPLSGQYTPTLTNTTNVAASTANSSVTYIRIGDVVTVSGTVNIDPTSASTQTSLGISLPIASNFVSLAQLAGIANRSSGALATLAASITADATNDRASLTFLNDTDVADRTWTFQFQYIVS
jgi:hypothetical protein